MIGNRLFKFSNSLLNSYFASRNIIKQCTNNIYYNNSGNSIFSVNFGILEQKREFTFKSYSNQSLDYKITSDDEVFQEIQDFKKYQETGNYKASKSIIDRSIKMAEQTLGRSHSITMNILFRLLNLEMTNGDLESSNKVIETILQRIPNDSESTSPYIIAALNYQMLILQYLGDTESSLLSLDRLIELAKARGDDTVLLGSNLNKAVIYSLECKEEAKQLYEDSLSQLEGVSIDSHLKETVIGNYATYLHSLGGNDELSEKLYQQAIDICKQVSNDLELAHIMSNYSEFLYDSDQFDKAITTIDQTITLLEQLYGRNNPKTGSLLYILGKLYRDKAEFVKAEGFFNKCITIFEDYKSATKNIQTEREKISSSSLIPFEFGKREMELRVNREVYIDFGNVLWEYSQMMRERGRLKEAYNLEERARQLHSIEDD
ncbi:hypothetical protein DLAC_09635 [Tieghemostelium lacteum]|uniref:Uncharacterized protein n=1 Tax=Tieghemostelium lacteum TaxID=361077 RepID=A0A151Z6T2_TIELA|nr:hypothetical protein DLAC_09635 [Tieghemostelium lacteum]|eukprot:KYQ89669.1 hypothetical protein DLAC_09635 [Tieghemostelium lacteum]